MITVIGNNIYLLILYEMQKYTRADGDVLRITRSAQTASALYIFIR